MSEPKPQRRPRHLLDPDNPRTQRRDAMSLTQVQRWVMSVLAVTTIVHLSAGLILAGYFLDDGRPGARAALLVIAGMFGMVAVAVAFLIHRRSPVSAWLLLGWLPSVVGAWIFWH